MFRVTYHNHVALSELADNKANILISINGVIISVMIAIVTRTGPVSWNFAPMLVLSPGARSRWCLRCWAPGRASAAAP